MAPRVAWYDVKGKGWFRDLIILLHPPYTIWHLAYVVIGAALAPRLNWGILLWTLLAFFLAMGIAAHCADELKGRPLRTRLPGWLLTQLVLWPMGGAIYIGITIGMTETIWIAPCIAFGAFIVLAYNMEWFRGFFHNNFWFGFAWGAFPVITAYVAQAHTLSPLIVLVSAACLLYSMAQRVLSFHGRFWRRRVDTLEGYFYLVGEGRPVIPGIASSGQRRLTKRIIIEPAEVALKLMTWTVVAAAVGFVLSHI